MPSMDMSREARLSIKGRVHPRAKFQVVRNWDLQGNFIVRYRVSPRWGLQEVVNRGASMIGIMFVVQVTPFVGLSCRHGCTKLKSIRSIMSSSKVQSV